jgi:ribosomal protein S18 acetylase RimI-like enzyme
MYSVMGVGSTLVVSLTAKNSNAKNGLIMDFSIRQANLSDLPYVYDICRLTGKIGEDASDLMSDGYIVGHYFAAPYLHFEIDTCFVLDDGTVPVGYIIGTSSTKNFNDWMNTRWLPALRRYYPASFTPKSSFEQFLMDLINRDCQTPDFLKEYPAHLHIDLLPVAQRRGLGKILIKKFMDAVATKGAQGIHLGVGLGNVNAIEFYKRMGFKELQKEPGALIMGISIG